MVGGTSVKSPLNGSDGGWLFSSQFARRRPQDLDALMRSLHDANSRTMQLDEQGASHCYSGGGANLGLFSTRFLLQNTTGSFQPFQSMHWHGG